MGALARKLRLLEVSCSALGVRHTVRSACAYGLRQLARPPLWLADKVEYKPEAAREFDERFETDTASSVTVDKLGIVEEAARKAAVFYVPSPVPLVRYMLRELRIDCRDYHFVDYGCGKGRVLMLASDYPFRSVRGVEIARGLYETAVRNLGVFRSPRQRCFDVQVACMDARDYPLPDGDTVFHFYHPFERELLRQVLEKIVTTSRASGRRAVVAYTWHSVQQLFPVFEELGFTIQQHTRTVNPRYQFAFFVLEARGARR